MKSIPFHPIADIFPMLDKEDLSALVTSISEHGLRHPIVLFEGKILDGRNRFRACHYLNISPETVEFSGTYEQAIAAVWDWNRLRRHLSASQAACADTLRHKLLDAYAAEREAARERKVEGAKIGGETAGRGRPKEDSLTQLIEETYLAPPTPAAPRAPAITSRAELIDERKNFPDRNTRTTDAARAKAAGTNRAYINAADKLFEQDPDRFAEVKEGKKTLTQAAREIRQEELSRRVVEPLAGRYRVIYADPPWKYADALAISGDGIGESYGPADAHYPQMSIQELCDLPVKDILEPDAVLFLWVTSPLLEDAFSVIKAWGFKYKSSFVWDKILHNMGHYNSVRHEFLLICTRGSCTPDVKRLFDSVQSIERTTRHSEKPKEFREMIDTLYPNGARIELFARTQHDNWQTWGNDVVSNAA